MRDIMRVWPYGPTEDWTDRIEKAHKKAERKVLFYKIGEIVFWVFLASVFVYSLVHVIIWSNISDTIPR